MSITILEIIHGEESFTASYLKTFGNETCPLGIYRGSNLSIWLPSKAKNFSSHSELCYYSNLTIEDRNQQWKVGPFYQDVPVLQSLNTRLR